MEPHSPDNSVSAGKLQKGVVANSKENDPPNDLHSPKIRVPSKCVTPAKATGITHATEVVLNNGQGISSSNSAQVSPSEYDLPPEYDLLAMGEGVGPDLPVYMALIRLQTAKKPLLKFLSAPTSTSDFRKTIATIMSIESVLLSDLELAHVTGDSGGKVKDMVSKVMQAMSKLEKKLHSVDENQINVEKSHVQEVEEIVCQLSTAQKLFCQGH